MPEYVESTRIHLNSLFICLLSAFQGLSWATSILGIATVRLGTYDKLLALPSTTGTGDLRAEEGCDELLPSASFSRTS